MPCTLLENIACREIVEGESYLSDNHTTTITSLQLNLAGVAFLQLINHIDGTIFGIGLHIGDDGFLFEIAKCGKLSATTHDGIATEKVARTGVELTHDDAVVGDGVAVEDDIANTGLLALYDADFNINGVFLHTHFNRSGIEEEIAIVHVKRGDVGTSRIIGDILL